MTTSAEDRFWELAAPLMGDGAVTRSTMMGYPCLRYRGRFFASIDRTTVPGGARPSDTSARRPTTHRLAGGPDGRIE